MKLLPASAVLGCIAMLALSTRSDLHATPASDASLHQCQASDVACPCGCATGSPCTCPNCPAADQGIASAIADLSARLGSLESKPETVAVVPEVDVQDIMADLQDAFPIDESAQEADAQPTPYAVIFKAIELLNLENTEMLLDFGCGSDARVLIHAFHDAGCRGVGIELDSRRATSARNLVSTAGLSPWIEIVEGDAVTTPVEGSVGFVYLWPETLEELRPKLQELDRFVRYAHEVPGLDMQRIDVPGHEPLWYWERSPEVSYAERPYAVYNGRRYYSDYNPGCNCSMCRTIRSQLASREQVERIPSQPSASDEGVPVRYNTTDDRWHWNYNGVDYFYHTLEDGQTYGGRFVYQNGRMCHNGTEDAPVTVPRTTYTAPVRITSSGSNCPGGNCGRPMRFRRR